MRARPWIGLGIVVTTALLGGGVGLFLVRWSRSEAPYHPHPTNPDEALAELIAGNRRYIESHRINSTDTTHDADDRAELARGQHPFVAILCCSDSRVCPEFVFDQRPGSIFEIRNAGNLVDDDVMASFEYAVEHLHVPLVMVLGHKRCGAVQAVHEADGRPLHDHLKELQRHMEELRDQIHRWHNNHSPACIDRLAHANAVLQARILLRESRPVAEAVRTGHVKIVIGMYDLETGQVEIFPATGPDTPVSFNH